MQRLIIILSIVVVLVVIVVYHRREGLESEVNASPTKKAETDGGTITLKNYSIPFNDDETIRMGNAQRDAYIVGGIDECRNISSSFGRVGIYTEPNTCFLVGGRMDGMNVILNEAAMTGRNVRVPSEDNGPCYPVGVY